MEIQSSCRQEPYGEPEEEWFSWWMKTEGDEEIDWFEVADNVIDWWGFLEYLEELQSTLGTPKWGVTTVWFPCDEGDEWATEIRGVIQEITDEHPIRNNPEQNLE